MGEKSGEEHALSFFDDLKKRQSDVKFWGVGGDELQKKGVELVYHLKDFSSIGLWEVVGRLPFYFNALNIIEKRVQETQTRIAILIDFQDFNLKLAKRLQSRGVCILYFVAPQAWAWRPWRTKALKAYVHTLFTILPFEKEWFFQRGVNQVVSVVHPTYRRYKDELPVVKKRGKFPLTVALLPGSRNMQVQSLLPVFLKTVEELQHQGYALKTIIVCSPNVCENLYRPYLDSIDRVAQDHELADVLRISDYTLSVCGTVSLTCALFGVLTVTAFKGSLVTEFFGRMLLAYYKGHLNVANLFCQREVFPVFLQDEATPYNMGKALKRWIDNPTLDEQRRRELLNIRYTVVGDTLNVAEIMSKAFEQHMS